MDEPVAAAEERLEGEALVADLRLDGLLVNVHGVDDVLDPLLVKHDGEFFESVGADFDSFQIVDAGDGAAPVPGTVPVALVSGRVHIE